MDNWFDERVGRIVEDTAAVARDKIEQLSRDLEEDARLMAIDVANAAEGLESDEQLFLDYFSIQTAIRLLSTAYVLSADGEMIAAAELEGDRPIFIPPPGEAIAEAEQGLVGQTLYERTGLATALIRLEAPEGAFLYIYRETDPEGFVQLRQAERTLAEYRAAESRSNRLQILFALGYAQIAALALLLFARLGLEAAGSITRPIGRLARAANTVRDGDLSVRVPQAGTQDEIGVLTESFNAMTEQLAEQRAALVSSRELSEDRRRFLETLLAKISAGVIRTDGDLTITLANQSAEGLIGADALQGRLLADVAPDFEPHAADALNRKKPIDASVEIILQDEPRHIRLKAAPDASGGCVLTFDDTTRLVSAQRQMAWRDVARRIAHEIRNPLTPIQLSAERLRKRYSSQIDADDAVFERCLDTIQRQVLDIGRMVEEFSNFARMPKPSVATFDLAAMVESAVFSQGMVSPDVAFEVVGAKGPQFYSGDERMLGQALANLMKNAAEAIEALPPEADVPGRVLVTIEPLSPGGYTLTIEDNGPGFPEHARAQFLEPYVTTRDRGSGLGLAIVNRIVMDHGGSVTLNNRSDGLRGAQVKIVLPQSGTDSAQNDRMRGEKMKEPA
ncbi:MAG: ATP-binding protein [Pseudomonadota bacterium]